MKILQGIIQTTYDSFKDIINKNLKLFFVRSSKDKDKGAIFFGSKMYGTADLYSSDESVKVTFDGKCGYDITTEPQSSGIKWTYL